MKDHDTTCAAITHCTAIIDCAAISHCAACRIFFEDPFWVGVFERQDARGVSAARYVFGSEPGEAELLQFALHQFQTLSYSAPNPAPAAPPPEMGFKRRLRAARRLMDQPGPGTAAQRALQMERERQGQARQAETRQKRTAAEEARRDQKQAHKKEKHRGR